MGQSSKRFRINTLLQLARITEDQELREELVLEIQELLDDVESGNTNYYKASDFSEEIVEPIREYLKDKYRVCAIEIWQKALGKKGRPQKWQATEIFSIVSSIDGWYKVDWPIRFKEYGTQRGFQRDLVLDESKEETKDGN